MPSREDDLLRRQDGLQQFFGGLLDVECGKPRILVEHHARTAQILARKLDVTFRRLRHAAARSEARRARSR
jgi:hypothetical protein